ncbi:hypothetical protein Tco_0121099, partial [Tanacetum coccineum]
MIGSLMYLTASRPDIMFAVCVCARHQVTPKECHLHDVKRIFRYLKGHPMLGLWYPKESPFDLVAYSDSDYDGDNQDRKSTTRGCQFLGRRLISWQCKKQTIVATSTTKAELLGSAFLALWNMFFGFKLVAGLWKLINVDHIHTDDNVADLLTKPFDVGRFQYLVVEHVMKRFLEKILRMSQFGEIKHTETYPVPSQTAKVFTTLRVNSPSFSGRHVDLFECMLVPRGEGLVNPTEPHHTPSPQPESPPQIEHTIPTDSQEMIPEQIQSSQPQAMQLTLPETQTISHTSVPQTTNIPSQTPTPRRLTKSDIRIAQSSVPTPRADELVSLSRDDRHGEAFPTTSSLDAGQDRENIPKTSAMPHESSPRVTSLGGDEGSLQQNLNELMEFCTTLQRQHT